jgi:hypothetical protein
MVQKSLDLASLLAVSSFLAPLCIACRMKTNKSNAKPAAKEEMIAIRFFWVYSCALVAGQRQAFVAGM